MRGNGEYGRARLAGRCRRGEGLRVRKRCCPARCLPHSRRRAVNRVGSRPCVADAQVIHKFANRNCGQPRLHRGEAGAATFAMHGKKDRRIKGLTRVASGNPQACQQKLWTTFESGGAADRAGSGASGGRLGRWRARPACAASCPATGCGRNQWAGSPLIGNAFPPPPARSAAAGTARKRLPEPGISENIPVESRDWREARKDIHKLANKICGQAGLPRDACRNRVAREKADAIQ